MLDDLKFIHQRDSEDAAGSISKQWQQLDRSFDVPTINFDFDNIVYAGMGGSALAGLISQVWPGFNVPFEVIRQYDIPAYVNNRTLFIGCSISGNTEETVFATSQADARGATVVAMASGGKLEELAKEQGFGFIKLTHHAQPRYEVLSNLKAITQLLDKSGYLEVPEATAKLSSAQDFVKKAVENWDVTVPTASNLAKKLAMELAGKSIAIYGGPLMKPAAYKWKISFNENAKNVAWWNEFPEFNHNEMNGWTSHPVDKPYAVVELHSSLERPEVLKRQELTAKILSGQRPAPHVVQVEGDTLLEQLLWAMALGDFVSLYLAFINNVDPGPVPIIEKFKKEL